MVFIGFVEGRTFLIFFDGGGGVGSMSFELRLLSVLGVVGGVLVDGEVMSVLKKGVVSEGTLVEGSGGTVRVLGVVSSVGFEGTIEVLQLGVDVVFESFFRLFVHGSLDYLN